MEGIAGPACGKPCHSHSAEQRHAFQKAPASGFKKLREDEVALIDGIVHDAFES
jgi:hypothetical protein